MYLYIYHHRQPSPYVVHVSLCLSVCSLSYRADEVQDEHTGL